MLNLPLDVEDGEEISKMPALIKSQYIENTIEKILDLNTETGVSVESIHTALHFDKRVISKHLEVLVARRRAYKMIHGNAITYFINGRLLHHIAKDDLDLDNRLFSFKALFDGKGVLLYVQENKKNKIGMIEEGGGIIVPLKDLHQFNERMKKIESEWPALKDKVLEVTE